MRTLPRLILPLALLTALFAGCAQDVGDDAGDDADVENETEDGNDTDDGGLDVGLGRGQRYDVAVRDNGFDPSERNDSAGFTVRFTNRGAANHTVTIHMVGDPVDEWVHDEAIAPDEETSYDFTGPGTYHVWCQYHGTMTSGMAMVVEATE